MKERHNAIFERFPEYREKIEKYINENEEFESLCFDYDECMNMLSALEKNTGKSHPDYHECAEIKLELEQEILKYLL